MDEVDRLRAALALKGFTAPLPGARNLPSALVELARGLVGDAGWDFVVGNTDALKSSARRRRR